MQILYLLDAFLTMAYIENYFQENRIDVLEFTKSKADMFLIFVEFQALIFSPSTSSGNLCGASFEAPS